MQAVRWGAPIESHYFDIVLDIFKNEETLSSLSEDGRNILTMAIGNGLYWYVYDDGWKNRQPEKTRRFSEKCFKYYCDAIELQQKSIFTFLWCWCQPLGNCGRQKDVGRLIAKMVWKTRNDYPCMHFP